MPTSRRTSSIFLRSLVSSMPSTTMRPCWCSSSRLMQRIMVDLPEPDGPQITIRSPCCNARLMSRSTWNSPYHLFTPIRSTAGSAAPDGWACWALLLVPPCGLLNAGRWSRAALRSCGIARHGEAEDQVEQRREDVAGGAGDRRRPFRIDRARLRWSAGNRTCRRSNTSVVSLNRPIKVLTMLGMVILSACGSTISRIICQ